MTLISIPVSVVILLLTAYLCIYIYRKDKVEKEPLPLLALLFAAGAACFFAAAFLEDKVVGKIDDVFMAYSYFDNCGIRSFDSEGIRLGHVILCALAFALIEEIIRGLVLALITHKNKNFNYTFDGIVYAVIMYLGFGMMEAFRYVGSGGFGSVIIRAVCCIPGQLFLGVIMGFFYTRWHRKKAPIPVFLLVPVLLHTLYSFFSLNASYTGGYMFEIIVVVLFIIGVIIIQRSASKDQLIAVMLCVALASATFATFAPADVHAAGTSSSDKISHFFYNQLDDSSARLYDEMYSEIKNGNSPTAHDVPDNDTAKKAVTALYHERPEYYWLRCGFSSSYYFENFTLKTSMTCSSYSYWDQTLNKSKEKKKLNDAIKKIAKEAKKKSSKYKQILYVHDYITNNCVYDYDRLYSSQRTIHDPFDEVIYSAYGCLVEKKAVCAGYAKAFQLIMRELGIKCDYVTGWGQSSDGSVGRHAWNCVTLDGKKYLIDATWDDYDLSGKNNDATHAYFLVNTKTMNKDHQAVDDFAYLKQPTAKGIEYNYFTKQKYSIKKYSSDTLDNKLYKQRKKAIKEVHFTTKKQYKRALKAIKNGSFQGYKTFKYNGFRYYWDDLHHNIIFTKRS